MNIRACIGLALAFLAFDHAAWAQAPLPAAFAKKVPESLQDLQDIESHVQKLVDKVMPSTVCLRIGNALGSGVVINRDGYILTAGHVSGKANVEAIVILSDGRRLRGKTLGANNAIDSGMVILSDNIVVPHLEMAKSADLRKGQWCLALGHPGGFKPGRPPVVRLGRIQKIEESVIVTDCALVGGDSGGPLFDMHGRVIGIHSRIGGKVTANVHVPIDTYRDTWPRLATGEVWGSPPSIFSFAKPAEPPYLGVRAGSDKMQLKVEAVVPGSPAEQAGLKSNDVILKIDNQALASSEDLGAVLKNHRPGARLNVQVQRGEETLVLSVILGKRESK